MQAFKKNIIKDRYQIIKIIALPNSFFVETGCPKCGAKTVAFGRVLTVCMLNKHVIQLTKRMNKRKKDSLIRNGINQTNTEIVKSYRTK